MYSLTFKMRLWIWCRCGADVHGCLSLSEHLAAQGSCRLQQNFTNVVATQKWWYKFSDTAWLLFFFFLPRERYVTIYIVTGTGSVTHRAHLSPESHLLHGHSSTTYAAVMLRCTFCGALNDFTTQHTQRYHYAMVQGEFSLQLVLKVSHWKGDSQKRPLERLAFVQYEKNS